MWRWNIHRSPAPRFILQEGIVKIKCLEYFQVNCKIERGIRGIWILFIANDFWRKEKFPILFWTERNRSLINVYVRTCDDNETSNNLTKLLHWFLTCRNAFNERYFETWGLKSLRSNLILFDILQANIILTWKSFLQISQQRFFLRTQKVVYLFYFLFQYDSEYVCLHFFPWKNLMMKSRANVCR